MMIKKFLSTNSSRLKTGQYENIKRSRHINIDENLNWDKNIQRILTKFNIQNSTENRQHTLMSIYF